MFSVVHRMKRVAEFVQNLSLFQAIDMRSHHVEQTVGDAAHGATVTADVDESNPAQDPAVAD
jgi:hypothetical protein